MAVAMTILGTAAATGGIMYLQYRLLVWMNEDWK